MTDTELLEAIRAMVRDELQGILRALPKPRTERVLLSVRAAADRLGVSHSTLSEWISRKKIKAVQVGARMRISQSEIDRIQREGVNAA